MTEQERRELSPEQQMVFDHDIDQLRLAGEQYGMKDFEGRVKFGLDPAAMFVIDHKKSAHGDIIQVEGTKEYAEKVAQSLGADISHVWPLIIDLHKHGPWGHAHELSSASTPEIQTYLVLASACHESGYPGYAPQEYLNDRERVLRDLKTFTSDQFESRKQDIVDRVQVGRVEEFDGISVPIAEGDVALPLAVQGFEGCVSQAGDMRFAQTQVIDDALLEQAGLVRGFGEVYDSELQGFKRVAYDTQGARVVWVSAEERGKDVSEMIPVAKRIASGYVLTYTDEKLALQLVVQAIKQGRGI